MLEITNLRAKLVSNTANYHRTDCQLSNIQPLLCIIYKHVQYIQFKSVLLSNMIVMVYVLLTLNLTKHFK